MESDSSFQNELNTLIGRPPGGSGVTRSPDPVNQPMIRHWAAAFEDANPVYTDPVAAGHSRFDEIVAPPLMLQTWTMPSPIITESEGPSIMTVFDRKGFSGTLAVGSEFEIHRHLRLGEVISASNIVESISEEKETRLGRGHFVTWLTTYSTDDGEVVGTQRFRILKFAAGGA
jgi:acyl dehydratase